MVIAYASHLVCLTRERREVKVGVYAAERSEALTRLAGFRDVLAPAAKTAGLADVTFWYYTAQGPRSYDRQLQVPKWENIAENYPPATREKLIGLQTAELSDAVGKLVLWQGEPGTGKTFALRALAEEWASWCRLHYVLDPERFLTEGDYLLSVILGGDQPSPTPVGSTASQPTWRLIILEDAGELLAKDAKEKVGQGLSRLLNLCDGLLGQGLRVLVLITTNEEVRSLHSAVSRPGRCLAQISFARFDPPAANEWLRAHGSSRSVNKQSSLADLYAIANGEEIDAAAVAGFV
jgi:hypothetical protein